MRLYMLSSYLISAALLVCILTSGDSKSVKSKSNPGLFDTTGKLENYDLSSKASTSGGTIIGIRHDDYSILINYSDQNDSKFILKSRIPRNVRISDNTICGGVGIKSDCTHMISKLVDESSEHVYLYNTPPICKRLVSSIASYIHQRTLLSHSRWFGIQLCLISYDTTHGSQVYEIDSFGNTHSTHISCIGQHAKVLYAYLRTQLHFMMNHERMLISEIIQTILMGIMNEIYNNNVLSESFDSSIATRSSTTLLSTSTTTSSPPSSSSSSFTTTTTTTTTTSSNIIDLDKWRQCLDSIEITLLGKDNVYLIIDTDILYHAVKYNNYVIIDEYIQSYMETRAYHIGS